MLWIKDHLLAFVEHYGVFALFISITFETLGLPFPGESGLIAAAAGAGIGDLNIWHVVLAAYAAAVLGDNIGYLIGRRYGRAVILHYGNRFGITPETYAKAEAITARYGPFMVIGARFVVLLRQLNGLVAGSTNMPWMSFLAANIIGAALWVGLWCTLAYQFGHSATIVPFLWRHLSLVAMIAMPIVLVAILVLYMKLRKRGG